MLWILAIISVAIGVGSGQLISPKISLPQVNEPFSINNILGNYYLGAAFNKQEEELFPNFSPSCQTKISIRIDSKDIVTITFQYFDEVSGKELTTSSQYIANPYEPTVLIKQAGAIYRFKSYKGQDDLLVVYYGEKDGQVILKKRDGKVAFSLSRTLDVPSGFNFLNIGIKALGFEKEDYIDISKSDCN